MLKNLPTYLDDQLKISHRAHGLHRSIAAPLIDLQRAIRLVEESPYSLGNWALVIEAAVEAALRSGSTPFALAQALSNRQAEAGQQKYPAPLAQFKPEAASDRQKPEAP